MRAITVRLNSIIKLTDDKFYQLCRDNPDVQFERDSKGKLIIMPPTGGETGKYNTELIGQFWFWNKQNKLGIVFDSSTGYKLPNSAIRSPDVSWIKKERWGTLTPAQQKKFIPIAPDFVLELISPTDYLQQIRDKMEEYIDNQVRLGWLINPETRLVEIYRLGQKVEILKSPSTLSGEEILPNFLLDLQTIWSL